MSLGFEGARGFYATIIAATVMRTLMSTLELDPIKALVWSAIVNGVIAVPIMVVMMSPLSDRAIRPRRSFAPYRRPVVVVLMSLSLGVAAADTGESGPPAALQPWTWSAVYKADLLGEDSPRAIAAMDNLNIQVDIDAAALFGWNDTALHGELLSNHGSKFNRLADADKQAALATLTTWFERAPVATTNNRRASRDLEDLELAQKRRLHLPQIRGTVEPRARREHASPLVSAIARTS